MCSQSFIVIAVRQWHTLNKCGRACRTAARTILSLSISHTFDNIFSYVIYCFPRDRFCLYSQ